MAHIGLPAEGRFPSKIRVELSLGAYPHDLPIETKLGLAGLLVNQQMDSGNTAFRQIGLTSNGVPAKLHRNTRDFVSFKLHQRRVLQLDRALD